MNNAARRELAKQPSAAATMMPPCDFEQVWPATVLQATSNHVITMIISTHCRLGVPLPSSLWCSCCCRESVRKLKSAPIPQGLSDEEIARNCAGRMRPIAELAQQKLGLRQSDLINYGPHKAKLALQRLDTAHGDSAPGKLILVR
eukprot:SAG11_NODE_1238_length_5425_cov_3.387908_4_plen_145_part_00